MRTVTPAAPQLVSRPGNSLVEGPDPSAPRNRSQCKATYPIRPLHRSRSEHPRVLRKPALRWEHHLGLSSCASERSVFNGSAYWAHERSGLTLR